MSERQMHEANGDDAEGRNWTYLNSEPFKSLDAYSEWLGKMSSGSDPFFHAVVDTKTGKAVGVAAFLRIDPVNGVIEAGHINYSPRLQRTPAATEAMFLVLDARSGVAGPEARVRALADASEL